MAANHQPEGKVVYIDHGRKAEWRITELPQKVKCRGVSLAHGLTVVLSLA
jgi:hypothetical protein